MPLRNGVGFSIAYLSAGLYTAGGSFSSVAWIPRLEAVEIAGLGSRQQYLVSRKHTIVLFMMAVLMTVIRKQKCCIVKAAGRQNREEKARIFGEQS